MLDVGDKRFLIVRGQIGAEVMAAIDDIVRALAQPDQRVDQTRIAHGCLGHRLGSRVGERLGRAGAAESPESLEQARPRL